MKKFIENSVDGRIEAIGEDRIIGWISSVTGNVTPVLLIGGRYAFPQAHGQPRPDVEEVTGLHPNSGFEFLISRIAPGERVELFGFDGGRLLKIAEKIAQATKLAQNVLSQLNQVARLSREPGATAIVCWEGGHNPIGRAKVLYDIARETRPTVLITYQFEEFGTRIWEPLLRENITLLAIPWVERHVFHRALRARGVVFDTVWISKERLPAFELASQLIGENTRVIVDHDDNEAHFSSSNAARLRFYGRLTTPLTEVLSREFACHTAASATLAQERGAELVRHARREVDISDLPPPEPAPQPPETAPDSEESVAAAAEDSNAPAMPEEAEEEVFATVGFIGTVRPHKGLIEAARAIKHFSWRTGRKIALHIYGTYNPPALRQTLEELGATTKGTIPYDELSRNIATFDAVLTGYPTSADDAAVQTYQISSKIGDGLAHGKPVLVPRSESVADLAGIDGVYLFSPQDFTQQLGAALSRKTPPTLPRDFSVEGASEVFERVAGSEAARGGTELLHTLAVNDTPTRGPLRKTVLLIWKQTDAGIYGRRIDQIARSYKRTDPAARVIVLELSHNTTAESLLAGRGEFNSDFHIQAQAMRDKDRRRPFGTDGVEYHSISCSRLSEVEDRFSDYLMEERIFPDNGVMILFPIIRMYKHIARILDDYRVIADVVDNHFSWQTNTHADSVMQYAALLRSSRRTVFNSENNRTFFSDAGFVPPEVGARLSVIPNWYQVPDDALSLPMPALRTEGPADIFYSGNLNDRIDWKLIEMLSAMLDGARLHIAGSGRRATAQIEAALKDNNNVVYWGALTELQTASLCLRCDVAIIPHLDDEVSRFMNPLKLEMYRAYNLPVVTTEVSGMSEHEDVQVASDRQDFVDRVRAVLARAPRSRPPLGGEMPGSAARYAQMIDEVFAES
ncbi:glycosyltransferase [Jannaschia seohaensis]|uniref:Glycosyl transferase family 1 n=1 Tax=Jannaschia seohaensis TaxID=475081 RepID=A0A2Y9B293_9RHOB|nr:glycosyltransferase [Jannaschia seohaensis]PWJ13240.1 glycosyl transferase family 1 [Jannaschia seohaensis]SSA50566.1 Glycosyl transferases group 1 [Jannaschia seohaensis]